MLFSSVVGHTQTRFEGSSRCVEGMYNTDARDSGSMCARDDGINVCAGMQPALSLKILCLEGQGRAREALAVSEEGERLTGGLHSMIYQRARMLRAIGQLKASEEAFIKCLDAGKAQVCSCKISL